MLRVAEAAGIEDMGAQPQLPGGFPSDGQLIARNHFHVHAHLARVRDGRFRVFSGRIKKRQYAEKLPWALRVRPSHPQRSEAARRKFVDGLLDSGFYLLGIGGQLKNDLRRALRTLRFPSAAFISASVRLCTGSNGWKWVTS